VLYLIGNSAFSVIKEVLTPADDVNHIDKNKYNVPFVCGCKNLGEALRRIGEGAAMIRTKGEAGTGNVVEAVRHARTLMSEIRKVQAMADEEVHFNSSLFWSSINCFS
jgi:pyridoxal 5'-phosphate synthase pdxS subunit